MANTSITEVIPLVLRERQSRDRSWYEQIAASYSADSHIEMSWFTGSGAELTTRTRAMDDRGDIAVHRLGPPTVHVAGDRALAELPLIIEWRIDVNGAEADLVSSCRSQCRAPKRWTGWVAGPPSPPTPSPRPSRHEPAPGYRGAGRLPTLLPVPALVPQPPGTPPHGR